MGTRTEPKSDLVRILIVDDETDILRFLKRCLTRENCEVEIAEHPLKALEILGRGNFDLLITDLKMPEMDGLALLKKVKEISPAIEVILMTGFATVNTAVGSMKLGAFDYLSKPFNINEIREMVERAIQHRHALNQVVRFRDLDQMKEEFLSNVSHELRTPLSAIKTASRILLDECEKKQEPIHAESLSKLLRIIDRGSNKMVQLVDDLLDIFRFEKGKVVIRSAAFSLERLLAEIDEEFLVPCQERGLNLILEVAPGLPVLNADPIKFRQAILNLLGNAMKFTPAGGTITIGARFISEPEPHFEIRVSDTGVGIPSDRHADIFKKFYQIDGSSTRQKPGLGLGLALVKNIVEAHRGKITLDSSPGQGTTFFIHLPAHPSASMERSDSHVLV